MSAMRNEAPVRLSPAMRDYATRERWMKELAASGFDGVIAKQIDCSYASGERTAMRKIKRIRTADCVVGGFRYASKGGEVGSLLLGLYDEDGSAQPRWIFLELSRGGAKEVEERPASRYMRGRGFTGHAPGGPSRWSTERSGEWEPLEAGAGLRSPLRSFLRRPLPAWNQISSLASRQNFQELHL